MRWSYETVGRRGREGKCLRIRWIECLLDKLFVFTFMTLLYLDLETFKSFSQFCVPFSSQVFTGGVFSKFILLLDNRDGCSGKSFLRCRGVVLGHRTVESRGKVL